MRPYGRSDDVVEAEIERGHAVERHVATVLRERGLEVEIPPQAIRPRFEDAAGFNDGGTDILVRGRVIQVKQRVGYRFTGPSDFKHDTVWVTTVPEWERTAANRPRAYILVSAGLDGYIVVPQPLYGSLTFGRERYDPTRRATRRTVELPTHLAWTLDQFVRWASSGEEPPSSDQGERRRRDLYDRDEQRRQDLLRFRAEQHNRAQFIRAGLDERQPPEYRGTVYDMGTNQGVAYFATPPYRDDPQGPLTQDFIDFQNYHGLRVREQHPEYYCIECRVRFASGRCPVCKSGRVIERGLIEDGKLPMLCVSCDARFYGERVCGPCLSKRPEVIRQMAEEKARKQRTRGRGGSAVPDPILYPD